MAFYLGSLGNVKININDRRYKINFYSTTLISSGIRLLTSEGYDLKDSKEQILTVKKEV